MPPRSSPRARAFARAILVSLLAAGCGAPAQPAKTPVPTIEGPVRPVDVQDADFSSSLAKVLQDGSRTPERLGLVAGVVRRQLAHAERRFALGEPERGTSSVMGALYLVRVGEGQGAMVDAAGARALDGAIKHLSALGDEGRVHALMRMRAAALGESAPGRAELDEHIKNLERWIGDTHAGSPGVRLGAEARYLAARAMVDPSGETLDAAAKAIEAWVGRGIEINRIFRQTGKRPERAEGMEAARSIETGAAMLASIFARHGDAQGALSRIESTEVRLITEPMLRRSLIVASEEGDAQAWEMLAAAFASEGAPTTEEDDREERLDPRLVEAGVWGSVLEAYRKDPKNLRLSALLAEQLVQLGMSEGAPAVLAGALGAQPNPRFVAAATRIVLEGMAVDADAGDIDAVRRTFRAAGPLLAAADRPEITNAGLEPTPARLRWLMASVEVRTGNLEAARPLYVAAAKGEPSVSAWLAVARADRQAKDATAALDNLRRAYGAPDARVALGDLAEAHLLAFEIQRDLKAHDAAKAELSEALSAALASRTQRGDAGRRARAETLLGRVLEAYGDAKAARRAHDRALAVAATDRPALGATVLQVASRALVRRDLEAARAAVRQGLEADVDQEERIYGGLWLYLLERELRAAPDDTTLRALSTNGDRDAWVVKLAQWALGRMTDDGLRASAQNEAQRVEAEFYTAMSRRASGDPAAKDRLRKVAESPVLDLVEVQLARDLLAPIFRAELPQGAALP
ncbi:hypothetical protein [Polyangium spumosum]|uniref:Tetratricopeptide repeat protein n=1 Tax=Polyangium spumosum TaxID=889282 RepID=A0A6N7Q791_9BACT|nr:hypothetical protein [Polyangium spumosum]MRG96751.1 hypothetical protein [Polyangium spumosum]